MKLENGIWTILGTPEEIAMSEERRAILTLLAENGAMSPKTIAECLRRNLNTLYSTLFRMRQDGQIIQEEERGLYKLPSKKPENDLP